MHYAAQTFYNRPRSKFHTLQNVVHITVGLAVENFCVNMELICQDLFAKCLHSMALSARLQRASLHSRVNFGNR